MPSKKSLQPPRASNRIRNVFIMDSIPNNAARFSDGLTDDETKDVLPTTRNQAMMKTNKATDAVKPGIKQSVKGVKPSITGMNGDREGRQVSSISRALRAIEDGLRAINLRRSPEGRAAYAAGKKAADQKIRRAGVDNWIQDRADAKPRTADDMRRELEG